MIRSLAIALALLACADAVRADPPPVAIREVSVGLPPGIQPPGRTDSPSSVIKFATWAPLYLDLQVSADVPEPAELVIETPDGDEVKTTLTVPLPALAAGQTLTMKDFPVKPYVRVAGGGTDMVLRVRTAAGVELTAPYRHRNQPPAAAKTYVVLALGSALPGFELPKENASDPGTNYRGGRIETAAITQFEDLPERWFGYDAADIVVLATGSASPEFLNRLFSDDAPPADRAKREALVEWIRRGGRLILSAGVHLDQLAKFKSFRDLLPYALDIEKPSRGMPGLFFRWKSSGGAPQSASLVPAADKLTVANLVPRPGRPSRVLLEDQPANDALSRPIAVQGPLGLGRVSFISWDLDLPPFTAYKLRPEFWDWVLRECGSPLAVAGPEGKPAAPASTVDEEDELPAALRTHLDTFADVPVVSFAYIAFFIVLYVILIGPLEYLLLKRLFGRLELTWLTFPLIVLSVCAAAYFTAVALKGTHVRVNKIDVVEVDTASGRVYGQAWFTLFSPKIDTYTVTVTPAAGWTSQPQAEIAKDTLTGWSTSARGGRASLLRRGYSFDVSPDGARYADALIDVPIQVWSTKSFTARWSAPLDAKSPVVEAKLTHPPGNPGQVIGTIVNRMPLAEIQDVVVIYAGEVYTTSLGTLAPGVERQLVLREKPGNEWITAEADAADRLLGVQSNRTASPVSTANIIEEQRFPMFSLLFHEAVTRKDQSMTLKNATLRGLDQSWRLIAENRDEVIVLGRLAPVSGPAEEALGARYSPTQLWTKGLPGDGHERSPLTEAGRQETFVRLYLPVR